jgi:hypothetical protein
VAKVDDACAGENVGAPDVLSHNGLQQCRLTDTEQATSIGGSPRVSSGLPIPPAANVSPLLGAPGGARHTSSGERGKPQRARPPIFDWQPYGLRVSPVD